MKQQKLMTARRILCTLILVGMIAVLTAALSAQASNKAVPGQGFQQSGIIDVLEQVRQAQAQQFEGSWDITVTPVVPPGVPQPPSFVGHATVSRGGGYFGSDRTRPFSKQHGAWAHLGGNDFAYTLKEDLYDVMGIFAGTLIVRVRLTITGRDTLIGVANAEQRDVAGNPVFNRCATLRGERIKIEPLAPPCQSITPPQ
jgi:hypothetical protein